MTSGKQAVMSSAGCIILRRRRHTKLAQAAAAQAAAAWAAAAVRDSCRSMKLCAQRDRNKVL